MLRSKDASGRNSGFSTKERIGSHVIINTGNGRRRKKKPHIEDVLTNP